MGAVLVSSLLFWKKPTQFCPSWSKDSDASRLRLRNRELLRSSRIRAPMFRNTERRSRYVVVYVLSLIYDATCNCFLAFNAHSLAPVLPSVLREVRAWMRTFFRLLWSTLKGAQIVLYVVWLNQSLISPRTLCFSREMNTVLAPCAQFLNRPMSVLVIQRTFFSLWHICTFWTENICPCKWDGELMQYPFMSALQWCCHFASWCSGVFALAFASAHSRSLWADITRC